MAKHGILHHRKFRRLVDMLKMPEAHVLGHLEMLWHSAYASCSDLVGDTNDLSRACGWQGANEDLVNALLWCSPGTLPGFIEERNDEKGIFYIHDLYENAPMNVKKRLRDNLVGEGESKRRTICTLKAVKSTTREVKSIDQEVESTTQEVDSTDRDVDSIDQEVKSTTREVDSMVEEVPIIQSVSQSVSQSISQSKERPAETPSGHGGQKGPVEPSLGGEKEEEQPHKKQKARTRTRCRLKSISEQIEEELLAKNKDGENGAIESILKPAYETENFRVSGAQHVMLTRYYHKLPGEIIRQQYPLMDAWLRKKPSRRPKSDWDRFLLTWVGKTNIEWLETHNKESGKMPEEWREI